jgi:cell division protein FtsW
MQLRRIDQIILIVVFLLLGIGVVQVYSTSYIYATEVRGDGLFFFRRQLAFVGLGIITLLTAAMLPWSIWRRLGVGLWAIAGLGVLATFIPGLGVSAGGAARWLKITSSIHVEPSEFLKLSLPLYLAWAFTLEKPKARWIAGLGWALPILALLKQPDFGSFVICMAITLGLLFANGLNWKWVAGGIVLAIPIFYKLVMQVDYRRARVMAFLDPWSDPGSKGFQVIQSMLSFNHGGLTGVGLGQGQGKLFFLPESHTDFTLAVLGEEMGFIGFFIVIALFGFLIFRGFQISYQVRDEKQMTGCLGITLLLSMAVLINAGVALGLFPTKGLALPFMSYGGSSLIATCLAVGIILSVEREQHGVALMTKKPRIIQDWD